MAVSEALRSEQLAQRSSIFIAYPEVQLGNLGSSLRRARQAINLASTTNDDNQKLQGYRLLAFVAGNAGWQELLNEARRNINGIALSIGERECIAYSHYCVGLLEIGRQDWAAARDELTIALSEMEALGKLSSPLRIRLLLSRIDFNLGLSSGPIEVARTSLTQYPFLLAHWELTQAERGQADCADADQTLRALWDSGRVMDIIDWSPVLFGLASHESKNDARRKILGAVQRAANSMDSAELRKSFLEFKKVKLALTTIQG